jgi:hypothetical protein
MARRKKESDDQPPENADQNKGSDDTFGLPEIEYQPINRDTTPAPDVDESETRREVNPPTYNEEQPITHTTMDRNEVHNENTSSYYDDDEPNSPWPKILGILALLIVIGAAVWYLMFYRPEQKRIAAERARQDEQARLDADKAEEERLAAEKSLQDEEQRKSDSLTNATPVAGTIETLNDRTGRYYVVIASSIDGDLIMDYAKKLNEKGVNAKIIPPYGNVKFHRLTVAEGDTFASTQQTADGLKGEYTDGAWVMKY